MMRLLALLVAAGLAMCGPAAAGKPQRIMSLNLCTDGLLLDLVAPSRIASITYLSRWPSNSYVWPAAKRLPVNRALAEEVLAAKPDLVLAGTYTATAARLMLKRLGRPLVEVPPANSFADIRGDVRLVAHAVGEDARGEALIAKMDSTLRRLAAEARGRPVRVAAWDGSGTVPSRGSLFDEMLTAAGGVNVALSDDAMNGQFDIEKLLVLRPDVLVFGSDSSSWPGLRRDTDQHPLVLKLYRHRRIAYPEVLYSCGVPQSADAVVALRDSLRKAMRAPAGAL